MTLLFDLDGTLIDSTEAILESFHLTFDILGGAHPSDEVIQSLIGHTLEDMYIGVGIDAAAVAKYVRTYKAHYRTISTQKTVLLPTAEMALKTAATFARLGVVTTKTGLYSQELLEHFGVMDAFEVLIGRENVTHAKPHPEPVLAAMRHLDASADACWLIGDTRLDTQAAKAAGIPCVGVLSGYGSEAELRVDTPYVVSDALAAVSLIGRQL